MDGVGNGVPNSVPGNTAAADGVTLDNNQSNALNALLKLQQDLSSNDPQSAELLILTEIINKNGG